MLAHCLSSLKIIRDDILLTIPTDDKECVAFFLKLAGDYYRYMSEIVEDQLLKLSRDCAHEHYKQADFAAKDLPACNGVKLGITLNFAVFLHEIMQET
jgi:hypothetical protein